MPSLRNSRGFGLLTFGLAAFLTIQLFGIFHLGMTMQPDGKMSTCPFMGKEAVCNMSPLEHIAALQNMFTATPQQSLILSILALLAFALIGFPAFASVSVGRENSPPLRIFERPRIFDPLRLAFARGIIHPKVF